MYTSMVIKAGSHEKEKHEELGNQASQAKSDVHASVHACMCLSTRCLDCIVVFAPRWRFLIQKSVCSYLFEYVLLEKLYITSFRELIPLYLLMLDKCSCSVLQIPSSRWKNIIILIQHIKNKQ
jgi:hypothetical protein